MPTKVTEHIEQFYEDEEILAIIAESPNLTAQFNEPDILNNEVCVVLPQVRRYPGYQRDRFDRAANRLDVFIKHQPVTELGQLELYRVRDFIRQQVDLAPVMHTVELVTGVGYIEVMENIKRQIQFLQRAENRDLPMASAQMMNSL